MQSCQERALTIDCKTVVVQKGNVPSVFCNLPEVTTTGVYDPSAQLNTPQLSYFCAFWGFCCWVPCRPTPHHVDLATAAVTVCLTHLVKYQKRL